MVVHYGESLRFADACVNFNANMLLRHRHFSDAVVAQRQDAHVDIMIAQRSFCSPRPTGAVFAVFICTSHVSPGERNVWADS